MVVLSVLFHIIAVTFILKSSNLPERHFITPVYTVDIVTPPPKRTHRKIKVKRKSRKHVVSKSKHKKPLKTKSITKKPDVKIKSSESKVVKKAVKTHVKEKTKIEEDIISDAIKRLENKERLRQEEKKIEEAIEKIKQGLAKEDTLKDGGKEDLSQKKIDVLSRIKQPTSVNREIIELKLKSYYLNISERIREKWVLPVEIIGEKKDYSAIIGIKIDRNGKMLGTELEESSGNRVFDDSVLKAIEKSAPFPPLPQEFEENIMEIGFRFKIPKEYL